MKINILGSEWEILYKDEDPAFEIAGGYTEENERVIIIENIKEDKDLLGLSPKAQKINQKRILRHELIHAYLSESGLAHSSVEVENWAVNEEMVDWFARMSPKIFETYRTLGLL